MLQFVPVSGDDWMEQEEMGAVSNKMSTSFIVERAPIHLLLEV